ncbi:MAG: glycosyltransferase [Solirubrobacterales bacterium]|jgi:trehalose synthase|nr:glycosyltransferase [Solirubrobacterales bacterium]
MPHDIEISPMRADRFRSLLPPDRFAEFERGTQEARDLLGDRVVWNVNSTARGGGVVELLRPLVAYARGAGLDVRWVVMDGTPEFFTVTKRIHNRLHGAPGDGGPLDEGARRVYEQVLTENLIGLEGRIHAGDVVILHDPQPAGMLPALKAAGAVVIWRCHVGLDQPNDLAREAWAFLRPYLAEADAYVFSREAFAWEGLDSDRIVVIHPTIDAFAPKNVDLDRQTVAAILAACGVIPRADAVGPAGFRRQDGTPRRIERRARIVEDRSLRPEDPVVLQVSRWDALKDPIGVIRGFAEHVPLELGAHLAYAGPSVEAVADDPEGRAVLEQSIAARQDLPEERRKRVHLITLPMDDPEENAIMVNALQRHAAVIVQKSISEGFGLTVAEAMWKARPVVASRIGGIQEQIVHDESGVLLDDPRDLAAYGAAVAELLADRERAERLGRAARERVRDRFLSVRSLLDYLALVQRLLTTPSSSRASRSAVA